jgi:hypothetical protein
MNYYYYTCACEVEVHGRIRDGYIALVTAIGSTMFDRKANSISGCVDEAL